jgi:demethylmenaquinone methyltransferase/2-methoxy-6-polyprenyl-1,4-benzoquinol methylase
VTDRKDGDGGAVFSRIARRYDRINRILSLGQDQAWRRRAIQHLPPGTVLDLGAGTGAANPDFQDRTVIALDPEPQMLALNPSERRIVGKGEEIPLPDDSVDGVFSAYVFRNLDSIPATLAEIARVLRPGGVAAIVDLGRPESRWKRVLHRIGSAIVLPLVGLFVGGFRESRSLHRSLDSLPQPRVIFADAPLEVDRIWRMGPFGFVYGVVMRKPLD